MRRRQLRQGEPGWSVPLSVVVDTEDVHVSRLVGPVDDAGESRHCGGRGREERDEVRVFVVVLGRGDVRDLDAVVLPVRARGGVLEGRRADRTVLVVGRRHRNGLPGIPVRRL